MTAQTQQSVQDWFDALPPGHGRQLAILRQFVLDSDDNMVETLKWSQPCYALNHLVCYLQQAKSHVTIGFQQGAALADPNDLLEGSGRMMRHIKIPLAGEINRSHVKALLKAAIKHDQRAD